MVTPIHDTRQRKQAAGDPPPPQPSSSGARHRSLRRRHLDTNDVAAPSPVRQAYDDERSMTSADSHPLDEDLSHEAKHEHTAADISRPTLRRLTSETERQVAESSSASVSEGSNRGSFDSLRMTKGTEESKEVEVLVHHVSSLDDCLALRALDFANTR